MATQNDQASLFDSGDTRVFTERYSTDATCGFCAVLRGEEKVTLIDENERLM
ncbi:MAG: hypothetical protein ACRDTE_17535 [Pseudonocardiaceae bacterium]